MRTFDWRHTGLATVLALGMAAAASAQPVETAPANAPGWSFTPAVAVGFLYDNNVSLSDAPASTGRTVSDQLLLIQPAGRLEFHAPRTVFSAGYQGFVRRYRDLEGLNAYEQRADVSLRRLATRRLTLFLNNNFVSVPTTDDVELNGAPFSRTGTRTNTLETGLAARLTEFTDLGLRYEHNWVDFDQSEEVETFLRGGTVHGVRAELSRRFSDRLSLGGEYALRLADLNEGTRDIVFQDAGGTARFATGPHTSVSAAAGVSHLDDRTLDRTRTGPYVRAGVTHTMARAVVGGSYERAFVPSFGFGGTSASQGLSAFVRMPFDRNRFYAQATGSWRRTEPLVETSLELDTLRLRTTFGYSATRWLRGEVFYTYARQDTVITGGEIDRQRVGLQFVISQPMRIR